METRAWDVVEGQQPVVATAIHDGHELREDAQEWVALAEPDRLREEDPGTGTLASVAGTQIVVRRSRFEVDLNRPRDGAVYVSPDDAWGLTVWKDGTPESVFSRSREQYEAFYVDAHRVLADMETRFGHFVVLDLHSYNHRRNGAGAAPEDPQANPEVNVGTGSLDRERWGFLVDRFMGDLRGFDLLGRNLDVRENVRFRGGHFSRWVHETFPESACCLAIEFKKTFMDEWTGEFFLEEHEALAQALDATLPGVFESLGVMGVE